MAEPSVTISSERGRCIRELINNPIITRFKLILVLVFVAFLVLYIFLSLMINNKTSIPNQDTSTFKNDQMLKLLERVLQALANFVLPMPAAVVGQAHSSYSNGTEKT